MAIIRFPLNEADAEKFAFNEVEPRGTIDLTSRPDAPFGVVQGFVGKITKVPEDPAQPGRRFTSEPFTIKLDLKALQSFLTEMIRLAGEQKVAGFGDGSAPPRID